ncbi:MAG: insulinase family protein [Phycisphaerae bacterium]
MVDRPGLRVCTLENGLTVIAARHDASPVVAARAYVRCGVLFEGALLGSGVSHLLEHLIAGGRSPRRSERACADAADAMGGLNNAYTGVDHTCYHITAAAGNAPAAVAQLADWLIRPVLSAALLRREIAVIERERERDHHEDGVLLEEAIYGSLFPSHPLRASTIGHADALRGLSLAAVRGYFEQRYVPDESVIAVVGAIEPPAAVALVAEQFVEFRRRATAAAPPADDGGGGPARRVVIRRARSGAVLALAWQTVVATHADAAALDVLADVLSGSEAGRLRRRLIWDDELAYDVAATHDAAAGCRGVFEVRARANERELVAVEPAIRATLRTLATRGPTGGELRASCRRMESAALLERQTADGWATELAESFLQTGDALEGERYLRAIRAMTPARVAAAARRYLGTDAGVAVELRPAEKPRAVAAAAAAARARASRVSRCANGLTVIALPAADEPMAVLHYEAPAGVMLEPASLHGVTQVMALALMRGAVSRRGVELTRYLDARGAFAATWATRESLALSAVMRRGDAPGVARLLAEVMGWPRFRREDVLGVRRIALEDLARLSDSWQDELLALAERCVQPNLPASRLVLGQARTVRAVDSAALHRWHKATVLARGAVVGVAGDFDADALARLVTGSFGRLRLAQRAAPAPTQAAPRERGPRLYVRAAGDARAVAGLFVGVPAVPWMHADAAALACLKTVLTGSALASGRLFHALRGESAGLVYEVAGLLTGGVQPGYLGFLAGCEPANVDRVYRVMARELERVGRQECGGSELARAQAMIEMAELERNQTLSDRLQRAVHEQLVGGGARGLERYLAAVRAVRPGDVRQVARRYLREARVVVLTPEPRAVRLGLAAGRWPAP